MVIAIKSDSFPSVGFVLTNGIFLHDKMIAYEEVPWIYFVIMFMQSVFWEGLRFVIVALPRLFSYLFSV